MDNKKQDFQRNTKDNKKVYLYKPKYLISVVILIMIIALICSIYKNKDSIKNGYSNSEKIELLDSNSVQQKGKVIVKYQDNQGKKLQDDLVLSGNLGDVYETQRPEISSYKSYGNDPINKIGNYDLNDIEVVYVYEKENDDVNIINEDNVITVQVIKGQYDKNEEIKWKIITKSVNEDIIKGANYKITDSNSNVIRNATSYGNELIVGSLTINKEGTDIYSIEQVSAPDGYEKLEKNINFSVVKTFDNNKNKYEVKLKFDKMDNVEIKQENGEIIVIITNVVKNTPEPTPEPKPKPQPKPVEEPESEPQPQPEKEDVINVLKTGGYLNWVPQTLAILILLICLVVVLRKMK